MSSKNQTVETTAIDNDAAIAAMTAGVSPDELPGNGPANAPTKKQLEKLQSEAAEMDAEMDAETAAQIDAETAAQNAAELAERIQNVKTYLAAAAEHNRKNRHVFRHQTRKLHMTDIVGGNAHGSIAGLALQNALDNRATVSLETWRELAAYIVENVSGLQVSQVKLSPTVGGETQSVIAVKLSRSADAEPFEIAYANEIAAMAAFDADMRDRLLAPVRAQYEAENKPDNRWALYIVPDILDKKSRQTWAGNVADDESASDAISPDA